MSPTKPIPSWDDLPDILRPKEVAEYLRISLSTAYEIATLPKTYIGGAVRYKKTDLSRYLAARNKPRR